MKARWVRDLLDVRSGDVGEVGGKNASLGEMLSALSSRGVRVPGGFAVTANAYRHYLRGNGLESRLAEILARDRSNPAGLERASREAMALFDAPVPPDLAAEITAAYESMGAPDVAVRSSATAEDLPGASFAGQQESFLHVRGAARVIDAVRRAYASLFGARAIHYRDDMRIGHEHLAMSAGVQRMVRSDLGCSGVAFTLDPESGHRGFVLVTSSYGLGEAVVQGRVVPDQLYVHKATLASGHRAIVLKKLGNKDQRCVYDEREGVRYEPVPEAARAIFSLDDDGVLELSRAAVQIEQHYSSLAGAPVAMDIEWAKDGLTGELFVVQARPETVHALRGPRIEIHHLEEHGERLTSGAAVGDKIATGIACLIASPSQSSLFHDGGVLVAESTDPDWEPLMKRASAVVTARGGRTSHAAIVARELGVPAIVGTGDAMRTIPSGETVTVSCAEGTTGHVYRGALKFHVEEVDASQLPRTRTRLMVNLADPERAFTTAMLPCDGVGLLRMEFIFAGWIGVHPMALLAYDSQAPELRTEIDRLTRGYTDRREFFVDRLSQGIATIAAAFHPRPVILRFSDFKTNEYAHLLGGAAYEPREENPMLGWRGASRYSHPAYRDGFLLEVAAVRRVREAMGLTNLAVMIPFCRTPAEGRRVLETMREGGLERGREGLEVLVMAELPSNVLLAAEFARLFDGFSIGSNDLTQLTLGLDRDSATVAPLFDEQDPSVKWSCAHLIEEAHRAGRHVGICGQAPSDHPAFAAFLVEHGIDSISVTPDAVVRTRLAVAAAERDRSVTTAPPPPIHP